MSKDYFNYSPGICFHDTFLLDSQDSKKERKRNREYFCENEASDYACKQVFLG
jgi:hypothetical protein